MACTDICQALGIWRKDDIKGNLISQLTKWNEVLRQA